MKALARCLRRFLFPLLAAAFLLAGGVQAQDLAPIPAYSAPVVDTTSTLTAAQQAELNQRLLALQQRKGAQLAVLLVPTTRPEPIETYAIRVAENWKVGRGGVDDGVLLIVAKEDRTVRIEVGYGLEGALPDASAAQIVRQDIVPRFAASDFHGGIDTAVQRIERIIDGEELAPVAQPAAADSGSVPIAAVLFMVVGGWVLCALLGRVKGSLLTGVITGAVAGWLAGAVAAGVGLGVFAFLFNLLNIFGRGAAMQSRGGRHGGGGFGGGGFGGGGFGGGMGGGFGGGGASGRW